MDRKTFAEKKTDKELEALEKKIAAQYLDAYRGLESEASEYFTKFEERYQQEYKAYLDGKYTKSEFYAWVNAQIARGKHWQDLRDNVAERMYAANEVAAAYINDETPSIWSLNYNFTAYEAEQHLGYTFELYDEQTVRRLIEEDPSLLPSITKKAIERNKDLKWNKSQFTKDVTSAILMGQHPAKLSKTCLMHTVGLNQVSAIRNARTAITSAQNGGRMDGYKRLAEMGVQMQKEWIATLDERTRDSHRDMDGERVPYDKPFSNGLMFPGDPSGPGREVWNCRCTMRSIFPENSEPRKVSYYGKNAEEAYQERDIKKYLGTRTTDMVRHTIIGISKKPVGKIRRGEPMTHEEADSGKVNPHVNEEGGLLNCQSCAVVYEGRLRGYSFVTRVYNENNKYMKDLSYDMRLAFVDPITKKHPEFIYMPDTIHGAEDYAVFLNQKINENERYTLDFNWEGSKNGHVVNVWRKKGIMHITDNQTGDNYIGDLAIINYLNELDYSLTKRANPKILRIDNMDFDYSFIRHIVEGVK